MKYLAKEEDTNHYIALFILLRTFCPWVLGDIKRDYFNKLSSFIQIIQGLLTNTNKFYKNWWQQDQKKIFHHFGQRLHRCRHVRCNKWKGKWLLLLVFIVPQKEVTQIFKLNGRHPCLFHQICTRYISLNKVINVKQYTRWLTSVPGWSPILPSTNEMLICMHLSQRRLILLQRYWPVYTSNAFFSFAIGNTYFARANISKERKRLHLFLHLHILDIFIS